MSTAELDSSGESSESVGSYSFIHDQKPCKDAKFLTASHVTGNAKAAEENKLIEEYYIADLKNATDMSLKHLRSHCESNGDSLLLGFESVIHDDLLLSTDLMGLDSCDSLLFEQPKKLCSDLDSHWVGVKKIEPWWHAVDKDDLASLASQTSSHHFKNCNHPGVHSMHVEKVSENSVYCSNQFEEQMTDKETKVSPMAGSAQGDLASVGMDRSLSKQGLLESIMQESAGTFRCASDTQESSGDLSRAQLLEALCHSQTRAREAEKLAQEACDEKDHVVNLFFQQASCLFAYRQWLRVVQLETLCLHLRSKDPLNSSTHPSLGPGFQKHMTLRKDRRKLGKQSFDISKCAVAFAIGLSLGGAGLLVGWTIGWLFPAF